MLACIKYLQNVTRFPNMVTSASLHDIALPTKSLRIKGNNLLLKDRICSSKNLLLEEQILYAPRGANSLLSGLTPL